MVKKWKREFDFDVLSLCCLESISSTYSGSYHNANLLLLVCVAEEQYLNFGLYFMGSSWLWIVVTQLDTKGSCFYFYGKLMVGSRNACFWSIFCKGTLLVDCKSFPHVLTRWFALNWYRLNVNSSDSAVWFGSVLTSETCLSITLDLFC